MPNCREQIYSEEYRDYLVEHTGDWDLLREWYGVDCFQIASPRFAVAYRAGDDLEYGVIRGVMSTPRCFGLLSSEQVLESMGVAAVQRQPSLNLYGNDVIVGFVDTGERVIILSS